MEWQLKLKFYSHFDELISKANVMKLVTNPDLVASNPFYPFIRDDQSWQPFRKKEKDGDPSGSGKPDKKVREIRYASRRDSYIFSYYRHLLMEEYEKTLHQLGLQDCVIAYRRIPLEPGSSKGKCNIHFAAEAIQAIRDMGQCVTVTLDISKYFDSIDHQRLHGVICDLIDEPTLPPDYEAVFKAMTTYHYVEYKELCRRLGFFGTTKKYGNQVEKFLIPRRQMPKRICSKKDFRAKIAGGDPEYKSIIRKNFKPYGIPQGSPISDVFANAYLLDFDIKMAAYAKEQGGIYRRYCDDILFILPGSEGEGLAAQAVARTEIENCGNKIKIKRQKTAIVSFDDKASPIYTFHMQGFEGETAANGFEYLGFRFDGKRVFLRDKSIAAHYRKVTRSAYRAAYNLFESKSDGSLSWARQKFDYKSFMRKFDRAPIADLHEGPSKWTFWTYIVSCRKVFGPLATGIDGQVKGHKKTIRRIVDRSLTKVAKKLKR